MLGREMGFRGGSSEFAVVGWLDVSIFEHFFRVGSEFETFVPAEVSEGEHFRAFANEHHLVFLG
jgi:hypothetical protein